MRLIFSLLTLLFLAFVAAQDTTSTEAASGDTIVLRVEDRTMTLDEFERRFDVHTATLASERGITLTPDMREGLEPLREPYLNQLATELVMLQEGARRGYTVDQAAVDAQLAAVRGRYDTQEAYDAALAGAGFADGALLRTLIGEADITRRTVEALQEHISLRDYQIQLYYDANRERYTAPARACIRHILVETREEAETLRQQVTDGADFAALAQEHSFDPASAPQGGDIGCFTQGQLAPELEQVAFNTPVNEASEPIQSPFGHHIVYPYERTEAAVVPLEQVRTDVVTNLEREVLIKVIERLREAADVDVFPERISIGR
jgi:peptidyl-prolyl cis-trans isomerase C